MPHVELLFPSDYIKAADLQGKDHVVEIERLNIGEKLKMTGGHEEKKHVMCFVGRKKKLVLNKTNARAIAKALDDPETDHWPGKRIALYPTKAMFRGDEVDAVRVRTTAPDERQPGED